MKMAGGNLAALDLLKHLQLTHGINTHVKHPLQDKMDDITGTTLCTQRKIFGVTLKNLQFNCLPNYGLVPCFLVDACKYLLLSAGTEGLFRKSSSVVRLHVLQARLDQGEDCLPTALPCDVANLVKQFFRELPDPILPTNLHWTLAKAQQLPTEVERTSAIQLLSCLLPGRNSSTLHFFFDFLKKVSLRYSENRMDSHNLAVIFTPSFLHTHFTSEQKDGNHKLQVAAIRILINKTYIFGVVPELLTKNVAALLDSSLVKTEEGDEMKRGARCSVGVVPQRSPKKAKSTVGHRCDGTGNHVPLKKRKSLRRSLSMIPTVLFGYRRFSSSKPKDSSLTTCLDEQPCNLASEGHSGTIYETLKKVVTEKMRCFSSSPAERLSPPTPLPESSPPPDTYQDTPVGICIRRNHDPRSRTVPTKPSVARNIWKSLCCTSDQMALTEDEDGLHQGELKNGMPPPTRSMCVSSSQEVQYPPACEGQDGDSGGDGTALPKGWPVSDLVCPRANDLCSQPAPLISLANTVCSPGEEESTSPLAESPNVANRSESQFQNEEKHHGVCAATKQQRACRPWRGSSSRCHATPTLRRPRGRSAVMQYLGTLSARRRGSQREGHKTQICTPSLTRARRFTVRDQVENFNQLALKTTAPPKERGSPLRFQRTPVCRYVRRLDACVQSGQGSVLDI